VLIFNLLLTPPCKGHRLNLQQLFPTITVNNQCRRSWGCRGCRK